MRSTLLASALPLRVVGPATVLSHKCDILSLLKEDQIAHDNRLGGGYGPDHLRVVSPGKRPRDLSTSCSASFRFICVWGCVRSPFRSLCIMYTTMVCFRQRPAKSRTQNLQGRSFLSAFVSFCCLGGGSLDGGDLVSPRCLGPSRLTPEGCGAAHGPRHPAYLLLLGLKCSGLFVGFCPSREVWVRFRLSALKQKFSVGCGLPFRSWSQMMFGSVLSLPFWVSPGGEGSIVTTTF